MTRTEILNDLIAKHGLRSYLEIGLQNKANNFDKINCAIKWSVDPAFVPGVDYMMTSDDFFAFNKLDPDEAVILINGREYPVFPNKDFKVDIVFIDGDHNAGQVEKDIINSMTILNPGGFIVIHDCNPMEEWQQLVPRQHKIWYGDVWRAFAGFVCTYPDVKAYCHYDDCGCGVIPYTCQPIEPGFTMKDISWAHFDKYRVDMLNLR